MLYKSCIDCVYKSIKVLAKPFKLDEERGLLIEVDISYVIQLLQLIIILGSQDHWHLVLAILIVECLGACIIVLTQIIVLFLNHLIYYEGVHTHVL